MNLSPVVNQKYITGTTETPFARARRREQSPYDRRIPEKNTARLCLGRRGVGGGERKI